jgi:sulfate adenylyltransferase subunit 1
MMNIMNNQLLRFTTAGSVDDGKSTLIGRLLYDSKSIFQDQIEAIETLSIRKGFDYVDLSLLTDGLKSEREQGITIDVAYRYFSTPKRKFIISDTPGHIQYTRNMVTGASTANLALILIDARKGILEQTCRHSYIASLLKIPHIIVCINKMDLVNFDRAIFQRIVDDYRAFSSKLGIHDVQFVPMSALTGDNIVNRSHHTEWYQGATLMHMLETIHVESDYNHIDGRLPVQDIITFSDQDSVQTNSFTGRIAGGIFRPNDEVIILPNGVMSKIKSINLGDEQILEAFAPMSVTITLEDNNLKIRRGDMIAKPNNQPLIEQDIDVMLCWMNPRSAVKNSKFIIRHTTTEVSGHLYEIQYKLDINSLRRVENVDQLIMNDIARVKIKTDTPLLIDSYRKNRMMGSLILVSEETNETVAAGMII